MMNSCVQHEGWFEKKNVSVPTPTTTVSTTTITVELRPQIPPMATPSSGTFGDDLLASRYPDEGMSDDRDSTASCQHDDDDDDDDDHWAVLPERLSTLHDHDCLVAVLSFLSWRDLNNFSIVSRSCQEVRRHTSLDQTRSGTILLGNGVSTAKEFLDKAKAERWSEAFCGHRTHLRLFNLTHLSSNIDPINDAFVNALSPLHHVQSLDCSMTPRFRQSYDHNYDEQTSDRIRTYRRSWFLAPFEDYVDKGFSQGVTLSMLVPNLRWIDMSFLPFTTVGIALLAKNNPKLEVIRWNRSLIWPVSNESEGHFEALRFLKEVYLDEARMILCASLEEDRLWNSLLNYSQRLERVSLLGTTWYRKGQLSKLSQDYLMEFVRRSPNLVWFRSDLTLENTVILQQERPNISFVSSH